MKTYVVLFEIESDRPPHEITANIRSAMESRGLVPSGIDINPKKKPKTFVAPHTKGCPAKTGGQCFCT